MAEPIERSLGDGLILRTVRDERDVVRYAAFHRSCISESEGAAGEHLLRYHPEMRLSDFLLVEDTETGQIVSTTCLIPWRCQIEDVDIIVAMLEMVATHPDYRHRGLVRRQIEHFQRIVRERHFDLSIIQGIPFYYRQFGYAYACDHTRRDAIAASRVAPAAGDAGKNYALRSAGWADIPALAEFYEQAMARTQVRTARSTAYWQFLIQKQHYPFQIVATAAEGHPVGYVLVHPGPAGAGKYIAESWVPDQEVALAVLRHVAEGADGELRIGWPEKGPLVQTARALGSQPLPTGQWLLRITDMAGFLRKLGPLLERRLAETLGSKLTADVCINLYREGYLLRFEAGQLRAVERAGFVDASMGATGGDLNIPLDAFVRLALGYRALDSLQDAWPDAFARPSARTLIDALFPPMSSYFCMPYHVFDA